MSYLVLGIILAVVMIVWILLVSGCEGIIDFEKIFSRAGKFCSRILDSLREDS